MIILTAPTTNRYKALDSIHLWIAGPDHFIQYKRRNTCQEVVDKKGVLQKATSQGDLTIIS